jgi:hypothetical protein
MKFLPFDNFQIHSHLSSDQVKEALRKEVAAQKLFSLSGVFRNNKEPYRGEIFDDGFTIIRNIHYKNSLLPVIRGKVVSNPAGTIIEVKMRLLRFVSVFMFLSFGLMFLLIAVNGSAVTLLLATAMFIVGYVIAMIGYRYEAGKAKKFLINVFGEQKFIPDNRMPVSDFFDLLIKKGQGVR